ncbi:hypothetical protein BMS3Bbin02_00098 [bacterium BMS3Bbin02]|nr:hypothetical protein BMS3Bbin02_00098 [bacterium BMS3Bbin02]
MKGLIYTAIYGGRDRPLAVWCPEGNVDYLMFTDTKAPKGWKEVLDLRPKNPRLAARLRKVALPEQAGGYDWALWIDGSHIPQVPIAPLVEKWLEAKNFAAYKHHHWDCTYKEIEKCKALGKDTRERLDRAEKALVGAGFPVHYGQLASTILARRVGSDLALTHARLWRHWIETYTIRDQVSFMASLWQLSGKAPAEDNLHWIGPNAFKNETFHYQGGH